MAATGAITRWSYDGLPFPIQRLNPDGSSLGYGYDADLNLVGLTNQKGERYTQAYDLADQLVEESASTAAVSATDMTRPVSLWRMTTPKPAAHPTHATGSADCWSAGTATA